MDGKRIRCLQIVSQHVPIYVQHFPSYSNRKCKKLPFSRTATHVVVSPGDTYATITQYVAWMERQFNACQTPRSMYLSIFNSFRVIRCMLKSRRKSKNRYFYHIFVSPGDATGAITLNIVLMQREFDAYKLYRCMCPSNYNSFWDTARYLWKKIVILSYRLHLTPLLGGSRWNIGTPFGTEKLEWCRYPMVKKFRRYVYFFERGPRMCQTDTGWQQIPRLCIASRGKNGLTYRHSFFHHTSAYTISISIKRFDEIPTGSPTTGALNTGGV